MRKIEIVLNRDNIYYNQNPQKSSLKFSILRKEGEIYKQIYTPFKCKDYFSDLILSRYLNSKNIPEVYGFKIKEPWNCKIPMVSLTIPAAFERLSLLNHFHLIRELEEELGIKLKSCLYQTNDPNTFGLKIAKYWIQSPVLISFYTLLIRGCCYNHSPYSAPKQFTSIKELIKNNSLLSAEDHVVYYELGRFDWMFFLKNIKDILGENPITGAYDKDLKKAFNKNDCLVDYHSMQGHSDFGIRDYHNNTGIFSFLKRTESSGLDYIIFGRNWVASYKALVLEK